MTERKIYKPKPISGFPEWLPEVRRVEQRWLDQIRRVFESYGYCSIETPSVEELDVITAKGEDVDKEIYVLERLQKEEGDTREARLALHFDQTVPFARYVALHFNDLTFPFKRYQIQKVWRGERPQAGRMREFYQCDIDVINVDSLPLQFDAEMPAIIWEILTSLPGMENEEIQIRISNRKILFGLLKCFGIKETGRYTNLIDKLQKAGEAATLIGLKTNLRLDNLPQEFSDIFIQLAKINSKRANISGLLRDFIARNDVIARSASDEAIQTLQSGVEELSFVMDQLKHFHENSVIADLSIVRGLDYYTGTVYETVFVGDPGYGSICSGGRYDDLAGNYINKHLPGVGISIGFTRLFDRLRSKNLLPLGGSSPAHALVLLLDEAQRLAAAAKAQDLRKQGFNVELFPVPAKIQKQFGYAEKKGIPFVFVPMEGGGWEIKDMLARSQGPENTGIDAVRKRAQSSC
ncbi:MAG: histidine--tRNA ligase [Alphaproteobacteria bacterium]